MWAKKREAGSYLISESIHLTNTYTPEDELKQVTSIELLNNPFQSPLAEKIGIEINDNRVTIIAENTLGAFPDMFFVFRNLDTEVNTKVYNQDEIPLEEGIELIEFKGPNPTTRLFTFNFRINWHREETIVDEVTSKATTTVEDGSDEASFSIRLNYDNSIAGRIIREIVNGRRELNERRLNRIVESMGVINIAPNTELGNITNDNDDNRPTGDRSN